MRELSESPENTDLATYVRRLETYIDTKIQELQGPSSAPAGSEELHSMSDEEKKQKFARQYKFARRFITAATDLSQCTG